jgi:uncharacterized protein (DUF1015 family)
VAILRPFRALRPPADRVKLVASVPYDVVDTGEARALAAGNPLSLLHVSRPEIDLPDGTDIHSDAVYAKGLENFRRLIAEAPLSVDGAECLYVYRLRMGSHTQTGVVGCCAVDDYDGGVVRRHERTRKDKEDDRTRHIVTLRAQTGPVFLCYRGDATIDGLVTRVAAQAPLYDFIASDGVAHTMWRVPDAGPLVSAFARVERTYIADGHHRAASASRARAELAREDSERRGPGRAAEYDSFLAVLFPASQLQILPYNRVVQDLAGRSPDDFLAEVRARVGAREGAPPSPLVRGSVAMYLAGRWYGLALAPRASATGSGPEGPAGGLRPSCGPTASLDVTCLQEQVLGPLLDIADPRTSERIDFVGGIRGPQELMRRVDSGRAAVAFSMYPTTVDDLMAIADAGEIMPPKSTWFEPKLRSGLVIHTI